MKKIAFIFTLVAITIAACKTSKETATTGTTVKPALDCSSSGLTYAAIKPIIEKNCVSCHSYGGAAGYNLSLTDDVKRAAKNGELLGTIKWLRGFPNMPENASKLNQSDIDQIECWINNGMKD